MAILDPYAGCLVLEAVLRVGGEHAERPREGERIFGHLVISRRLLKRRQEVVEHKRRGVLVAIAPAFGKEPADVRGKPVALAVVAAQEVAQLARLEAPDELRIEACVDDAAEPQLVWR